MKQLLTLKQLNQRGIHHILMPLIVFVLLFGIAGSYFLLKSHAAPWSGALEVGSHTSGYCMDVTSYNAGAPVELNKCNNKVDQKWELMSAGSFQKHTAYTIETFAQGKFMCVDNWGQSKSNPSALRLYKCNGVDPAQRFVWTWVNGNVNNLYNIEAGRCIDDPQNSTAPNTALDLASCKTTNSWGQMWFEVGNTATASSTPVSSTGSPVGSGTLPPTSVTGKALQLGYDRSLCMENMNNSNTAYTTVEINHCANTPAQSWTLSQVGNNQFQIKAQTSKACVEDPSGAIGTTANNRVVVDTAPCSSSDHNQIWMWSGSGGYHELKNAYNNGCINDPAWSKTAGTRLIIYSCSANSANEQWYEAAL